MRRLLMTTRKAKIVCVLALCLGLALSSVSVLAQKSSGAPPERVKLNSATAEQLQSIPGIGPATAKSILEYRAKIGKFNKIEEIINVKGVGEKKFQKIKDRLVV
jgi:comEA protein